jgi:subtilisin-like proprotein convertase family protein
MKKNLQFSFLLFLLSLALFAQSDKNWKKIEEQEAKSSKNLKQRTYPSSSNYYSLNLSSLRETLFSAPKEASSTNIILGMPNVNGEIEQFKIWESSNFAPELQAQFPEIRAYAGAGVVDKTSRIFISVAPNGIQTMILRADRKTEFMEPVTIDGKTYAVFNSEKRKGGKLPFTCTTKEDEELMNRSVVVAQSTFSNTQSFKTFRLALSCTSEYTTYHGGTVANALAAMNATMTRVNGVYNVDLAVKLEMIANNASLIYTNAATDPYSDADDGAAGDWNLELQQNLTTTIGNTAYDIGHLFGDSGGGGNAGCIGCVCVNPTTAVPEGKGSGYTSPSDAVPEGDTFDIDYVAHEMGHQLGANHTFSHSYEGTGVNVEPGSGSTIMGYAGITNYNVQDHSDDYFTYRSILQIQTNLATKTCPTSVSLLNNPPTVSAGADYTIPKGTPFILTGTGSDSETGNLVTYTWEQNDSSSSATAGASSVASGTKTVGPTWRSVAPSASPVRYFPALSKVLANTLTTSYESVSNVARTLNFTLTARDHGAVAGQTSTDATVITVSGTVGPFDVTSQAVAGISYSQGSTQTITWAVNSTTTLPGSTNVDILLSTDGGLTFPTVLKSATANDGTETVTIPNIAAPYCRIMVKPTGHIYYDVNPVPFSIGYTVTNTCTTYTNSTATAIPDNGSTYSTSGITIPATNTSTVYTAKVNVDITHTYIGDIYLALLSPTGTQINLFQGSCTSNDNMVVTFSDNGTNLVCASPISGTYLPVQALSAVTGQATSGVWTLGFVDTYATDTGTLNSWSIEICSQTAFLSTENFGLTDFKIYPNPNHGNFMVQFNSNSGNDVKINVNDIRGRQIFEKSYQNTGLFNESLQLNNLQSGVYLVTVQDGDRKEVKKIVIQ